MAELVAAVDVGTGSARAGIFDRRGRLLGRAARPIALRRPAAGQGEHDGEDIWSAVAAAVRAARSAAGAAPEAVAGLAFDATCSLVVCDAAGGPIDVSGDGETRWNTIAWFDHRARAEAEACTATGHPAIAEQGGAMSPEMQIPKLLWLKRRLPDRWARMGLAFDLADFLSWKATGSPVRSAGTLTCKWGYGAGGSAAWPEDLLAAVGLGDLRLRSGITQAPVPPGAPLARMTPVAARELGLTSATVVAAGAVDAYAGALGLLAGHASDPDLDGRRMALIAGTSSCLMGLSRDRRAVTGLWGPYRDAVLPGLWAVEGGQSASGALLDHLCRLWLGREPGEALHDRILHRIEALLAEEGPDIAPGLHVLPDFHGNRSPLADHCPRGVISGLGLDWTFDGLCRIYWRTSVALALGLRQILETFAAAGYSGEALHLAGGHARSRLLTQLYADALGRPLHVSSAPDAVLLGGAILAATASGMHATLADAAVAMAAPADILFPDPAAAACLDHGYAVFRTMQRQRSELDRLTAGPVTGVTAAPSAPR
jgi:FGGY-family pentulose kinase